MWNYHGTVMLEVKNELLLCHQSSSLPFWLPDNKGHQFDATLPSWFGVLVSYFLLYFVVISSGFLLLLATSCSPVFLVFCFLPCVPLLLSAPPQLSFGSLVSSALLPVSLHQLLIPSLVKSVFESVPVCPSLCSHCVPNLFLVVLWLRPPYFSSPAFLLPVFVTGHFIVSDWDFWILNISSLKLTYCFCDLPASVCLQLHFWCNCDNYIEICILCAPTVSECNTILVNTDPRSVTICQT